MDEAAILAFAERMTYDSIDALKQKLDAIHERKQNESIEKLINEKMRYVDDFVKCLVDYSYYAGERVGEEKANVTILCG